MKLSGGRILMESLLENQTDLIFGYPGGAIMPIYDALYDYKDKLKHVLVRHEQGAAHAAEGYARLSGKVGVCFATSGPGATNLVTGIADAMMDSVPLVCITGQVYANLLGTDAFQETDMIGVTTPITKWNYQITKPDEVAETIAKAFYIARTGRPGPVLIDITKNAQIEKADFKYPQKISIPSFKLPGKPNDNLVKQAAKLINNAQKPFLIAGHGVIISKAFNQLKTLAQKADIPVASTLLGLSAIPSSHPLSMGILGMHGKYSTNVLTNQADVIIAVGMRFDDRVTGRLSEYAKQAKIIHIDIDASEINKNTIANVAINADAKSALEALIPKISKNEHTSWLSEFNRLDQIEFEKVTTKELTPQNNKIKMAQVVNMLSDKTKGRAVVVADVGQHQMVTARYFKFQKNNSFLTSGGAGTMGYALPAAIGAKMAQPQTEVIAIIGDGSFQMTIQELATIAQEGIAIKIIILNNKFLGMVRQWQDLFFDKRYSFVDLKNPDFVAVAKGFYIYGEKVTSYSDLEKAIERLLKAKKSYLLEVEVEKETNVFPMVPAGASVEEVRLE
ncbi:biosynthetic-type acetolactate synthase large subunit [Candidatus Daviesbacteria bacterium]|nr:biosynthetic-type acetolactate synthase large subunit [Candidatus Daviesbacteria bacterium]